MSTWQEIDSEDIDVDFDSKEINLLMDTDDFGNNYRTLTFDQIKEIFEKMNKGE